MKKTLKFILFLFLINSFLYSSENISKKDILEDVSLQLLWKNQFEFAGFYIAKEKEFYKDAGLNVDIKEFNFGIDVVNDVHSGKSTYGVSYPTIILEKLKGKDLVLLSAILQSSPHVLVSLKSSGIKSIKDFKNKNIMINHEAAETASFLSMLRSQNISINELNLLKHSFNIESLINKETDIIASYASNELYHLDKKNIKYNIWDPKDYGFDFYDDILFTSTKEIKNNPSRVKNFIQASKKGWEYAFENIEETVNIILEKYNTQNKTKEALIYEANVLKKLAYSNNKEFGDIDKIKIQRITDIYGLMGLTNKSIDLNEFIYKFDNTDLTLKERRFLATNKIKCITTVNWEPFNLLDNQTKKPVGIALDYWETIKKNMDINGSCEPVFKWNKVLDSIKNKTADVTLSAAITEDRKKYALFSKPYVSFPIAIATRNDHGYMPDVSLLNGKKVAVGNNFSAHKLLKKNYPNINFIPVENLNVALSLLSKGEVYAAADILPVLAYNMNHSKYSNLKISGTTSFNIDIRMMIAKDKPELVSIINKAIDSITDDQKQLIYNKWISIKYVKGFDYTTLWYVIAFFSFIILVLFLWQRTIKNKNQELMKIKENLDQTLNSFKSLINSTLEGIVILEDDKCIDTNDVILDILGYDKKEELTEINPFDLIAKESLKYVKNLIKQKDSTPHEIDIIKKNGELISCLVRIKELTINNKNIRVVAIIDISNLKEKEKVILQQSKMVALGEMIGNIAHQWRQPLSIISTQASGTYVNRQVGIKDEDELLKSLSSINDTARELSNTIDTFRDFIKDDKTRHIIQLKFIIERVLYLEESIIKKDFMTIEQNLDETIEIETYKNELEEVLVILINNAHDQFESKNIEKPILKIETFQNTDYNFIKISDNAGGVPENIIDRIFEPYFTTKHKSVGTGLGLHISYKIITESLHGDIFVENINNGACFTIKIPKS